MYLMDTTSRVKSATSEFFFFQINKQDIRDY